MPSLTADAVRALAPDAGALKSGQSLANARHWSALGHSERALWGACQGSGKEPYAVVVDLSGPVAKCTCPSRKFPCKHALGLMFMAVAGSAGSAGPEPADVAAWLADREKRATAAAGRSAASGGTAEGTAATGPVDDKTAKARERDRQRRVAQREDRIAAGMDDFRRWLQDLARRGLADVADASAYEAAAARLVDAQAGELARDVRALARSIARDGVGGEDVLDRIGLLSLISETWDRRDRLDDRLGAELRSRIGWTIREADLPEADDVADRWLVVARRHEDDNRLRETRTWLYGADGGRWIVVLDFAPVRTEPSNEPPVGATVEGRIGIYPGASGLRGALRSGWRSIDDGSVRAGHPDFEAALASYRSAVGGDPFLERWPVAVAEVSVAWDRRQARLALVDRAGSTVPARFIGLGASSLIAFAGGRPVTVSGEWDGHALDVLAVADDGVWIGLPGAEVAAVDAQPSGSGASSQPAAGGDATWVALRALATVGTARAEPDPVLAPLVARMADRTPEDRLLALVSALSVRRRVATRPGPAPEDVGILPPAPIETLDRPPPSVARAVAEPLPSLRDERFAALARHGWLIPPELLPTPAFATPPRDRIVLGHRAAWLARYLSGYRPLGADVEDVDVVELVARLDDDSTGLIERQAYLRAFRRLDPAAARAWLEAAWDGLRANDKAMVAALEVGIGADDLPFLERAGREKNRERRAMVSAVLARLPSSPFVLRLEARGRALVERKGRFNTGLRLLTPTEVQLTELEEDGHAVSTHQWKGGPERQPTERAWEALEWHLRLIRPSRWTEWLGLAPGQLIEELTKVVPRRWGTGPSTALAQAAITHADPAFAAAILAAGAPGVTGPEALWDLVPAKDRPALVLHLLRQKGTSYGPDTSLQASLAALADVDGGWNPAIRNAVVADANAAIGQLVGKERWRALSRLRAICLGAPIDLLPGIIDRVVATDADTRDIIELAEARRRFAAIVDAAGDAS